MLQRKLLIFLVGLFLTTSSTVDLFAKDQSTYYGAVNDAELKIVAADFAGASKSYRNAFKIRDSYFASDLFNASICAVKIQDYDFAFQLCGELAEKGVGPDFFLKNSVFGHLKKDVRWSKLIDNATKQQGKLKRQNTALIRYMDSLVARDQEVNRNWRSAPDSERREKRKIMDLTYDTLSKSLLKLFDSVGFLSEFQIGVQTINDTTIDPGALFDVIIIHSYQARMEGDTLFTPILKKALANGLIKPYSFAFFQDFGSNLIGRTYYGTSRFFVQYNCNLYRDKIPPEQMLKIEADRSAIGLESLNDNMKKIVYLIAHRSSPFHFDAHASKYMSFADKSSEDGFFASTELIFEDICK